MIQARTCKIGFGIGGRHQTRVLHLSVKVGSLIGFEIARTYRFCLQSPVSLDISMVALEGSREVKRLTEPPGNPSWRAGAGTEHVPKLRGSHPNKLR